MSLVLDASLALSWFFVDEQSEETHVVLDRVSVSDAKVPSIWRFEIANAFQASVRRKRIDAAFRDAALRRLISLPIAVDPDTDRYAWTESLRLADIFALTMYDAVYLELARRHDLPLATLDLALAKAARESNLEVLGQA